MNSQTANMALKRMGYGVGQLVYHGMKSLASTVLNEYGFAPDIVESALAHIDKNTVIAAYNRAEYVDRRRDMMDWWSKRVSQSRTAESSVSALSINMMNLRLCYRRGNADWSIDLWVRNLTDTQKAEESRYFNFVGKRLAKRFMEPRTYGLSVNYDS
jgi:hypothetical protein